jgi:hypothetical protein
VCVCVLVLLVRLSRRRVLGQQCRKQPIRLFPFLFSFSSTISDLDFFLTSKV